MSINCLKCVVSCTPSCCMDQFRKTTATETFDQEPVPQGAPNFADDLTGRSRLRMVYIAPYYAAVQQQPSPNALVIPHPTTYQKDGERSNQTEYETARALFSRIHADERRQGELVVNEIVERPVTVNRNGDVYKKLVRTESVELPCVFDCFASIKQLFCGS